MSKEAAFWDASALVPLCVHEPTSRQAQSYLRKFMPVVWWGSTVEVHSAIMRLRSSGRLKGQEIQKAISRLDVFNRGWTEILPLDQVRDLALRMPDLYNLRAADSFQLAAALTWCQQRPARRIFICSDRRLSDAARAAGFSVLELATVVP